MGLILWLLACGNVDGEPPTDAAPTDDSPTEPAADGCRVGDTEACVCESGNPGTRTCVGAGDVWSACGCDLPGVDGEDLYEPPPPPEEMICLDGAVSCPPYRGDDATLAGAHHCCLADGTCGSESSFLFGEQCMPRGGEAGTPDAECPDEYPNFLDLYGCCRSDGLCGLTIDHVSNWDIGCVERTEMARRINEGSADRDLLSLVFFLPVEDAEFRRVRCTP